ncbi:WD40 repeat-like protein [Rhizoclosmatium globosum]|uniref:WD40 repeat-like protein n=1 Tax=Rhizoclosmatium globosum TaxID=329046 RepID=A0A1Y2CDC7_9FUNG|nr:WD40 repeat-like protein [Rhizoclosmatium globosum]|eukprot:ORY44824.1 WD40 repeat-like protein [Rhizoclosmatium globosum]
MSATAQTSTRLAALTPRGLTTWSITGTAHTAQTQTAIEGASDVSWSADGRLLATPLSNKTTNNASTTTTTATTASNAVAVSIRDAGEGRAVEVVPSATLPSPGEVAAVAFGTRRSSRVLYLASGRAVLAWDRRDKKIVLKFAGHTDKVTAVAVNVDETTLASGSANGELKIHSLKTNTSTTLSSPLTQNVNKCAFSPFKKSTIAAVGDDGCVVVWDFNTSTQPMFIVKDAHVAPIQGLCWSPCNKSLFATAGLDRKVLVYNKDENGKILLKFEADSPITSLAVNDDFLIAAGSISGKITLFDVRTRKSSLYFHATSTGEPITSLAFEPPQWAQETSQRDQGGMNSGSKTLAQKPQPFKPSSTTAPNSSAVDHNPPGSGSPVVAALKERMAAVKEKQAGLMDLFSPVKPAFRTDPSVDTKTLSTIGGSSNLREVMTANEEAEDSEDVSITPVLLNRVKKESQAPNTLDLFSPLAGTTGKSTQPPLSSSPPLKTPTSESDPFLSKPTHQTSDPIARLQNALNQLKSKTPVKSTTPEDTMGRNTPHYSRPMSPIFTAASQENLPMPGSVTHTGRLSRQTSLLELDVGKARESVALKNLPGSPGHVTVKVSEALFSKFDAKEDASRSLPEKGGNIEVMEHHEEEQDDDTDIWLTKEVLGADLDVPRSVEGKQWTGGLVGDEFSPPTSMMASEPVDVPALKTKSEEVVKDSAEASGGYAHKVLEAVLESCLQDFRKQVKEDIQNMHLELLRQFYIQKNEISQLFQENSPTEALLKEVVRLREENARLRCGFQ